MGDNGIQKRVTIRDVAQRAQVTPAIVSRVINSDKTLNIKDETRANVLEAIKALNYVPNSVARSLRTQTSNTIGVLISDIANPFYTEIVKGIQSAAAENGYTIVLCDTTDSSEVEKKHIEKLRSQFVDGIILASSYVEDDVISMLEDFNIKYVLVNRGSGDSSAPYVKSDDTEGIAEAMKYLLEKGHRRIAHLAGPLYAETSIRRLSSYRKALYAADIPYNSQYVVETMFDEQSGYEACNTLLKLEDRPTAICAANDMTAIGAMRAIKEAGLSVPEDISIIGYNDIWVASKVSPALTTVRCNMDEMGKKALKILMELIKGTPMVEHKVVLPTKLIKRESVKELSKHDE